MSTPTRWEQADNSHYADRFAQLIADGEDIDGEARLVDVLAPRGARVLDAGSGIGRVGAALAARGHDVTCVEKDEALVAESLRAHPDLPVLTADLLDLTPQALAAAGAPPSYDVVVAVGNVMVYLADGTAAEVLTRLADLLAPGGRLLVGFTIVGGSPNAATYPEAAFRADADRAGLEVVQWFGGYDLSPAAGSDFAVSVLSRSRTAAPAPTA